MASGWNLWVWLQCIGVASRCCYKEVYIDILIIIINFPYSTCIRSFFGRASLLLCSFLKCFFGLYNYRFPKLSLKIFKRQYVSTDGANTASIYPEISVLRTQYHARATMKLAW